MEVAHTGHEESVSLLDQTTVGTQLDAGADTLEHADRRADIAAAIVQYHHAGDHLVLLQLGPVPSLFTDDPFEPGDVLLPGLDHSGARRRSRVLASAQQVGPRQGQKIQQVTQQTRGVATTIDENVPDKAASAPFMGAGGGNQVSGPPGYQLPRLHHALPRGPHEPSLFSAPSG